MANLTTSCMFFENGTPEQFEYVLSKYEEALEVKARNKSNKPETLIKLDKWYQNELPKKIKSRGKEAHLVHDELVQTIKWKLARGVFRPRLKDLVQMNTPRVVMQETKKAFRHLFKKNDLEAAVAAMSNLKGVGPAMASAVLAAGAPETAPFMADECLLSMPGMEGIDYTMKEYMKLVQKTRECCDRLNSQGGEWTPHKVELAVWTHYVARDLKPELLDGLPDAKDTARLNGRGGGEELNGINGETAAVNGESAATDNGKQDTEEQDKDSPAPAQQTDAENEKPEPSAQSSEPEKSPPTETKEKKESDKTTAASPAKSEAPLNGQSDAAASSTASKEEEGEKTTTTTPAVTENGEPTKVAAAETELKTSEKNRTGENGTAENGKSEVEEDEKMEVSKSNGEAETAVVNGQSNGKENGAVESSEEASNDAESAKEVVAEKLSSSSGTDKVVTECQKRPLDTEEVANDHTDASSESEPKRLKPAEDIVGPPAIPAGGE